MPAVPGSRVSRALHRRECAEDTQGGWGAQRRARGLQGRNVASELQTPVSNHQCPSRRALQAPHPPPPPGWIRILSPELPGISGSVSSHTPNGSQRPSAGSFM